MKGTTNLGSIGNRYGQSTWRTAKSDTSNTRRSTQTAGYSLIRQPVQAVLPEEKSPTQIQRNGSPVPKRLPGGIHQLSKPSPGVHGYPCSPSRHNLAG